MTLLGHVFQYYRDHSFLHWVMFETKLFHTMLKVMLHNNHCVETCETGVCVISSSRIINVALRLFLTFKFKILQKMSKTNKFNITHFHVSVGICWYSVQSLDSYASTSRPQVDECRSVLVRSKSNLGHLLRLAMLFYKDNLFTF